jgi:tetratricopeptide (TPR) repeat protein
MEETFSVRAATGESTKRAAVIFSSVNANGFSFFNLFEQFSENLHRIYVRDPYDCWYDKGVSEDIDSWDRLSEEIQSSLKELGATQVMVFGSSMGGYASLRLSSEINPHTCIAISPQTLLDRRLPHTPQSSVSRQSRDISLYMNSWRPKNAAVFFGAADFVDIFNVFRINWLGVDLFPIAGQDHLVAQYLLGKRAMLAIVEDFVLKGAYTPNLRLQRQGIRFDRACFDDAQRILINRIVEGYYLEAGWDVLRCIKALKALHKWADAFHLEAKILAKMRRFDEAIISGGKALALAPNSVTISDGLAEILRKAERTEEAIAGYRNSLKLRAKHYQALCSLAELEHRQGNVEEASRLLQQAVEVRPRQKKAQNIAEKLGISVNE